LCLITTNLISALWHGFYFGYIATFLSGGLATMASRIMRKRIRPFFIGNWILKLIYDITSIATMHIMMGFGILGFELLTFQATIYAYWQVKFYGLMMVGCVFLLNSLIRPTKN
jgi:hypothetical protein